MENANGQEPMPSEKTEYGTVGFGSEPGSGLGNSKRRRVLGILLRGVVGALAAIGLICILGAVVLAVRAPQSTVSDPSPSTTSTETKIACEHDWTGVYATVHHDATYKTVHHDDVYKDETRYETVCDTCAAAYSNDLQKAVISGKVNQHFAENPTHSGWSTNVPVVYSVLATAAYDEQVVDTPAYDSTELSGFTCQKCGAAKSTSGVVTLPAASGSSADKAA